jgi:single-strand DNA-binding protein
MAGVNKVILVGNLGRDPEVRTIESGAKVANFSLATTESYVKDGNRIEQTEWHRVTVWRGLADIAEKYLHKGKQVYIEGRLTTRKYTDKDGVERQITEILGLSMTLLGSAPRDGGGSIPPPEEPPFTGSANSDSGASDDLPF